MTAARTAVVVGGGIAGLAGAALLAHDGWDVDILERSGAVGGRAGTWDADGFRFDTGPSWYLMPEVFDRFFAQLVTPALLHHALEDAGHDLGEVAAHDPGELVDDQRRRCQVAGGACAPPAEFA